MTGPTASSAQERARGPRLGPEAVRVLAVVLIVLALGALLTWCARSPAGQAAHGSGGRGVPGGGGRPPTTVGTASATLGAIPITVQALGTVTPLANVSVTARVAGMLDKVTFREGERVNAGQLLAQIDPRPFQAALDQARAQMAHDQAVLQQARLDLERYRTLQAENSIATQQVDAQAALARQSEATVAADKAAVDTARLNLSFTRITAPVSGLVGLRQIDPGNQIVANGSTPIVVVAKVDPISVVFSLPQNDIAAVRAAGGGVGLAVTALDSAGGQILARGRLASLDNLIDVTTGTVKARADFANPAGALYPNQFVNVSLLVRTLDNQVVVPATAVRHGPNGDFVWVLRPGQTVRSRNVRVGPGTPETVSIVAGLAAGETVITDGGDRLRDGAKVVLPGQLRGSPRGAGGRRHRGAAAGG